MLVYDSSWGNVYSVQGQTLKNAQVLSLEWRELQFICDSCLIFCTFLYVSLPVILVCLAFLIAEV